MKNIRHIAETILAEMGGDAEEICTGSCPDFAKQLIDRAGRGQIVSNLSDDMADELDGYEVIKPEAYIPKPSARNYFASSHCWVKIDGKFYDAYNPEGVSDESELQFILENA